MGNSSKPKKVFNSVLAFVLAASLVPAQALAAEDQPEQTTQPQLAEEHRYSEDVTLDAVDSSDNAEEPSSDASSAASSSSAQINGAVDIAAQRENQSNANIAKDAGKQLQAQQPVVVKETADYSASNMLSLDMDLSVAGSAVVATIDGLTYTLDTQNNSATLVGVNHTVKGAVNIPNEIAFNNEVYAVANICTLRGGVPQCCFCQYSSC